MDRELLERTLKDPDCTVVLLQGILSRLAAAEATVKHLLQLHGLSLMLEPPTSGLPDSFGEATPRKTAKFEYVAVRHRGNEVSLMNQGWSMWRAFVWDDEYCHLKPDMVLVMRRPKGEPNKGVEDAAYYCLVCGTRFVPPEGHREPIQCPKGHDDVFRGFESVAAFVANLEQHRDEIGEALMGRDI